MTAAIIPFPRRGVVVPFIGAPLQTARDLALENLRKAYRGAKAGNPRARANVEVYAKYAGDEEVRRLAQMLLDGLDAVEAPSDVDPEPAA
jgi:hypothetical protein